MSWRTLARLVLASLLNRAGVRCIIWAGQLRRAPELRMERKIGGEDD